MKTKVYEYSKCSTCRNALKFLDSKKVSYTKLPIVDQPPSITELKQMLKYLKAKGKTFKNLFNTSGIQYREEKIGDKIKAGMSEEDAIQLLSKNGKLIKRPFILTDGDGAVGFQSDEWKKLFK
ncbi:MAG: hypothetical protein K0R29_2696 [Pseudobdellovibrio sp.]|jgi:arsenate reductase|nr:hypothetical protein [Pseudobdellovibrio sp.]